MQAWGNKLLWGYDTDDDPALQAAFNAAVRQQNPFDNSRVFFDTGDSYGTGTLEGRAEARARVRVRLGLGLGLGLAHRSPLTTHLSPSPSP